MRFSVYASLALAALIVGAALSFIVMPIQAAPVQAQAVFTPRNLREQFAIDLLAALGNTQPTADTVAFVVEWTLAEDGGDGALARNNPLNTTMCGYNMTGAINGDGACGVQTYATYQDGINATVATLAQSNFSAITYALQTNDAAGAFQSLIASGWASSQYSGGVGWPHVDLDVQQSSAPSGAVASNPIGVGGDDCGWNVRVALDASGGALQSFTIAPGETWSFNAAMGNPGAIPYRNCAGVPGGNWCNLAARYAQVARRFDTELSFQDHGVGDLGGGPENSVAIWNDGGQAGGQDLQITNRGSRPIFFGIQGDDMQVSIIAWEG